MTVSVAIDPAIIVKMRKKAEEVCEQFSNRIGVYGHNKVEQQVSGWMGEYAVRVLYRQGGVQAHQNIKDKNAPDLTIPAHSTLQESFETRQEEVKSWKSGFSWNEYERCAHQTSTITRSRSAFVFLIPSTSLRFFPSYSTPMYPS